MDYVNLKVTLFFGAKLVYKLDLGVISFAYGPV